MLTWYMVIMEQPIYCGYKLESPSWTTTIGKLWSNSRMKPQMYVRISIMYEKAAFCLPELVEVNIVL